MIGSVVAPYPLDEAANLNDSFELTIEPRRPNFHRDSLGRCVADIIADALA